MSRSGITFAPNSVSLEKVHRTQFFSPAAKTYETGTYATLFAFPALRSPALAEAPTL